MNATTLRPVLPWLILMLFAGMSSLGRTPEQPPSDLGAQPPQQPKEDTSMTLHYLEIVTPDVDATCESLSKLHVVQFGDPDPSLGNARTATLKGGGRIGVRAPMGENEKQVVRPYMLVDDLDAAVEKARAAGAEIALPSMEIPGEGTIAIYFQGGIEHGLWQR